MTHGLERKSRAHAGNDGREFGLLKRFLPKVPASGTQSCCGMGAPSSLLSLVTLLMV